MYRDPGTTGLSYWGAFIAAVSGYSWHEWASIFGITFGFLTWFTNWYYKRKEYQLRLRELELRITNERKQRHEKQHETQP